MWYIVNTHYTGTEIFVVQVTWLVVTEVGSKSFGLVTECHNYNERHVPRAFTTMHVICCDAFSSLSVVSHAFSVRCMYSKFGHHPHPLGYFCAKFRFFHSLHCWANLWRKLRTHSLSQSPSLYDAPGTEASALENPQIHNKLLYIIRRNKMKNEIKSTKYWNQCCCHGLEVQGLEISNLKISCITSKLLSDSIITASIMSH